MDSTRLMLSLAHNNQRGVSLLELMIAVIFIAASMTVMASLMPLASRSSMETKLRWQASEICRAQLEQFKTMSYGQIDPTPATNPPFGGGVQPLTGCDCQNSSTVMGDSVRVSTVSASGKEYTVYACINFVKQVGNAWQSQCPAPGVDTNSKAIRVRVVWTVNNAAYATESNLVVNH